MKKNKLFFIIFTISFFAQSQNQSLSNSSKPESESKKKWYEAISLRGYAQIRYNKLFETNPDLGCEQCDRSWGGNNSFFIRRGRLIFSGNVHERVFIYIQPDFASDASATGRHFFQLRDAYFDLALDENKEYRFRIGQSKVPYGFENMQSSQNRIALDRADGINSAVANERDLGVFFYWATKEKRILLKRLVDEGLKGSGDYGLFGIGIYNGQTANRPEANTNQHIVARFTYPFEFKNGQIFEAGLQAYNGKYVVNSVSANRNVKFEPGKPEFNDQRIASSIVWYPQPFGIQAEFNIGTGPQYNPKNNTIEQRQLQGGYVQLMYQLKKNENVLFPFIKYHWYEGGKKHELDARNYKVNDLEIGFEWQVNRSFEFVADYTISSRRYEDAILTSNFQKGSLLRLQAQFSF